VMMILNHDLYSKCNSAVAEMHFGVLATIRLPKKSNLYDLKISNTNSSITTTNKRLGKKKRTIPQLTMSAYDIL